MKERIHLWWLRGYDNPKLVERYLLSFCTANETVERNPSTVEHTKRPKRLSEEQSSGEKARGRTSKTPSREKVLRSETPSREELNEQKKCLGITKGFLCFKQRGRGVYLVTYDPETKRKVWKLLGSWEDLKRECELK